MTVIHADQGLPDPVVASPKMFESKWGPGAYERLQAIR